MRISDWSSDVCSSDLHAWNEDARRFRNFMNFDRSWCEDAGSEDSNGRTLWALGVVARDAQMAKHHDWARALYDQTAAIAFDLGSPRAEAFAMLGAAALLDISPDHAIARRTPAQRSEERRVGKDVSVRLELGGRRIIKKTKTSKTI